MYLVTESQDVPSGTPPNHIYFYLHAVDIQMFSELTPVRIVSTASPPPDQDRWSELHIQRPGLLYLTSAQNGLTYDTVYVAFSMIDGGGPPYPEGWLFAYKASDLTLQAGYQTSQGGTTQEGGGIWMGGAAPAYGPDKAGGSNYIYLTTANGDQDLFSSTAPNTDAGDAFLKLEPSTLAVTDYFTPSDYAWRECNMHDVDFGSGGLMLVPTDETYPDYWAIGGDKEGGIWFIDRANPGKCKTSTGGNCSSYLCSSNPPQDCTTTPTNPMVQWIGPSCSNPNTTPPYVIHNNATFWETGTPPNDTHYLFVAPAQNTPATNPTALTRYKLCPSHNPPICGTTVAVDTDGVTPYTATG
jgi:hypothetical protein